jgi:biopolymer transport protein ExbB/TolQ
MPVRPAPLLRRALLLLVLAASLAAAELRAEPAAPAPDPLPSVAASAAPDRLVWSSSPDMVEMLLNAGMAATSVMLVLALTSIWLAAVSLQKSLVLRRVNHQADRFLAAFRAARSLDDLSREDNANAVGPMARMFAAGMDEYHATSDRGVAIRGELRDRIRERIGPAVRLVQAREARELGNSMTLLAGMGAAAPLLGLLGTVCAIISGVLGLAAEPGAELASLAPRLASALLATAIGLATAIPAVLLYARFVRLIGRFEGRLEDFAREFAVALAREIDDRWPV